MNGRGQKFRRLVSVICIAVLCLSVMAACNSSGTTAGSGGEPAETGSGGNATATGTGNAEPPFNIDIMVTAFHTDLPGNDSVVVNELEEYTNTELNIIWVPDASYEDKFNITMASGDMPKIILVKTRSTSFINAVRSGAFWELGPYLKDYPNLSRANEIVLNNISIDGKIYAIYRARPLGRMGISFRKDWLDNLGLQEPKTVDDFYNMLKAFTYQDPDQNGADDTYGMVVTKYPGPWDIMQTWFGAPNKWGEDENKNLVPAHLTPEYMDALKFFRKLYEEKLINQDFAVMDSALWNDPVINGQAGVIVDVTDRSTQIIDKVHETNPDADFMDVIGTVEGPQGLRNLPTTGYNGMFAIPKSSVKTEEELKKTLAFLDKLNDEEMQVLLSNGIKDRHYRLENGAAVSLLTSNVALQPEMNSLSQLLMFLPERKEIPPVMTRLRQKVQDVQKANESIVVANPAEPLISNVYALKGTQLDNIVNDARIKFIVGQLDESGFQAEIDLWKRSGGDDYIKEMNEMYKASKQ